MIELVQPSFVPHGSIPQGAKLGADLLAFQPSVCIPQRVKMVPEVQAENEGATNGMLSPEEQVW